MSFSSSWKVWPIGIYVTVYGVIPKHITKTGITNHKMKSVNWSLTRDKQKKIQTIHLTQKNCIKGVVFSPFNW